MSTAATSNTDGYETIRIPSDLFKRLEARLSGSAFTSVEEWVVKLLQSEIDPPSLSQSADDKIRQRLKALGYE